MEQTSFLPGPPAVPPAESDEFYTPWERFWPWNAEFRFSVDVAATAESAKCPRFYTAKEDGLAQSWAGERVWCNPPYSDIAPWVRKAEHEVEFLRCPLVVMLLPATKTEQPWWQEHVEPYRDGRRAGLNYSARVETRFLPKRIAFGYPGNPNGGGSSGRFGNVLVIWRAAP